MNKRKVSFKVSAIMLVVAGLVISGVASAALVNSLSNQTRTKATISSPITMNVNPGRDGSVNTNSLVTLDTFGGSDFQFTTVAKNNTNNDIQGYRVIVVDAPEGKNFTGGEIDKVMLEYAAISGNPIEITDRLVVVYSDGSIHWLKDWTGNSRRLVLITSSDGGSTATKAGLVAGETDWNTFTMTTSVAIAPGAYNIYSEFTFDLAKYAAEKYAGI